MQNSNDKVVHSNFWTNIFNSPTEKMDLEQSLLSIPVFRSIKKRDLHLLLKIIHNRSYVPGEFIFYQGDPGIGLYIIREGEVQIERETDAGEKITLATFSKGDFFGELALVDGEKRSASAVAVNECRVAVIFKPDLDEFIERYPKKGIKILSGISSIVAIRLRKLNEDYFQLIKEKLKTKEEDHGT
ncbi:MAG: cyclic nucleotide-binding domain-containing protein [Ignavibacterium sp.]|nr:cyclic nucleotide-binding domain-containing protein [Ignavibacterium sp.]